eukprot:1569288-Rhodomonas_salina.1
MINQHQGFVEQQIINQPLDPVLERFMQSILSWQWTFWAVFMLPCIAIVGALLSVIIIGKQECFWNNEMQMPRWDHHTDSIQMPGGDWEEDVAFPAVSNLPEMYVKCASRDKWIFASDKSRFNTSEFFFLFLSLTALLILAAVHTLVGYCRLVIKTISPWPSFYYLFGICLVAGIVGLANVQGAYGKAETDAHFVLGILYFVGSFLIELLVVLTVAQMPKAWSSLFTYALFAAVMAFIFRVAYVVMYFISDAYPNSNNSHLFIYSTQNFLTYLFTFFQLWMVQSFPKAENRVTKMPPPIPPPVT